MGLQHLFRRLRRSPMFACVTLATLAIGIGANTAIFSVLDGILLRPLPYPHAEQLISVTYDAPGVNLHSVGTAPFLYFIQAEQNRTLQSVGIWTGDSVAVTGTGEPRQIDGVDVSEGVLPTLGAQPFLGRLFNRADDSPDAPKAVVLSYSFWQSHFGGDRSVIGRNVVADGVPRMIIGVLPADFRFLDMRPELFLPMRLDRSKVFLGNFSYQSLARMKPGVTLAQASADAARLVPVSMDAFPPFQGYSKKMFSEVGLAPAFVPLKQEIVGDVGKVLWILMTTIGIVLLIACANVANLLLVRTEGRQQELAIRSALGAGWGRLARELLAESVILGLLGGVFGLGLAYGAIRWLIAVGPANLPRLHDIAINTAVLLFTLAASLFAGLLFGAIPILKYAGPHLATSMRTGGRSVSRERHRARNTLVVLQVALAMLLLIGSGLMIRTFRALRNVQPGFTHPEQVQTLYIYIPESDVKDPVQAIHMQQNILEKASTLAGVESAALTTMVPMSGSGWHDPLYAEDHTYSDSQIPAIRSFRMVSPGLAKTVGNHLVAGRDFTWTDIYDMRPVVILSENLAREFWHDPAKALGRHVRETSKAPWREVIGVVADSRDDGVSKPAPGIAYWPLLMKNFENSEINAQRGVALVIRSSRTGTSGFLREIGQAVWSVDPNLPLASVRTLREVYDRSLARTSFTLVMLGIAGAMAMLLGVVGIYGVISYSVSQRKREIGIRMALGSPQRNVTGMFVTHGLRLSAIGVAFGTAAAVGLTRLMKSLLFETSPLDPATYAAVAVALVVAATLASYLPALRATHVDPTEALRSE